MKHLIKTTPSILVELAALVCSAIGIKMTVSYGSFGYLYFTIQSNIWIAATLALFALWQTLGVFIKPLRRIPRLLYILKFVFTVSITLTGGVFCFVLAPTQPGAIEETVNILTHIAVPLLAIVDLFLCRPRDPKYRWALYGLVPPIYYLVFASIGYVENWDFGQGTNYPYFFLNWDSPAGAFGFADPPYIMGTFYWILVMIAIVAGFGALYVLLLKIENKILMIDSQEK